MRIRTQLAVSAATAVVVTALLVLTLLYVTRLNNAGWAQQAQTQDVARDIAGLLTLTNEFAVYGGERAATQWELQHARLVTTLDAALAHSRPPPISLVELRRNVDHLPPLFEKLAELNVSTPSALQQRKRELLVERLLTETQEVIESRSRWAHELSGQQRRQQTVFNVAALSAPALLLVLLVGLGGAVARRLLASLARIEATVGEIRAGNLGARCGVAGDDEIGDTARAVDAMIDALSERTDALRRVERQLRTIMEASPLGMFHCDLHGRCLYVNPAWTRIAGLTFEQSLGKGWWRGVHPQDRRLVARSKAGLADGLIQVIEHRYVRPSGDVVWVRGHAAALFEDDRISGVIGTVEDISERKKLDAELVRRSDELARSNKELEQFAYVASHDLQEPLRMVSSYSHLLTRRCGAQLDGEGREFLGFIEDGGKRAQALIADLLSLARVNSQVKPMEPVPLSGCLDQVLRGLRLLVADTAAVITQDPGLPVVLADRRQLAQLLQNLVANALKFRGRDAPRIHVGARRERDGRWHITVADNGIGIDPKFHERVFGMFQRLHLRSEYAGTGIGLAICKKVVERHGGAIGVESALGHGATFWFTLADGLNAAAADGPDDGMAHRPSAAEAAW